MSLGRGLALVLALLLAGSGDAAEKAAPAVLAAERAAGLIELDDEGALPTIPTEGYRVDPPSQERLDAMRDLPATARTLDAHLASRPADARGLVARGRLLRQQYLLRTFSETGVAIPAGPADPREEVVALLDRALEIDSTRAEAHYWKAVTLATPIHFAGMTPGGVGSGRFEEALAPARTAHRLAPADTLATNLLERCLLATGNDLEAEALRDPSTAARDGLTPVGRIRERLRQVPVPPGVRAAPQMRETLGLMVQRRPGDATAASRSARAAVYRTESVSVDSLEAFYRATWPDLTWTDQRTSEERMPLLTPTRFAMATLQWRPPSEWVPAAAGLENPFERTDVLLITIMEYDFESFRSALPDSLKDQPLPAVRTLMLHDRVEESR